MRHVASHWNPVTKAFWPPLLITEEGSWFVDIITNSMTSNAKYLSTDKGQLRWVIPIWWEVAHSIHAIRQDSVVHSGRVRGRPRPRCTRAAVYPMQVRSTIIQIASKATIDWVTPPVLMSMLVSAMLARKTGFEEVRTLTLKKK